MAENDMILPPLIVSDEEYWSEVMGDAVAMWMQNSASFFDVQKRKVKEIAWGPLLFGFTEFLPKAWVEILVSSGLIERNRLASMCPLNQEEHVTYSIAEHLLESCLHLMTNKGDLKTILNFIHDVEERPASLDGAIDFSYALREILSMDVFNSMWAPIRRIYEKKKKSHAGVCVIFFFKIIHQQVIHYGQNGGDKIDMTKDKILLLRTKRLGSHGGQQITAENLYNSASKALKRNDYHQALSDFTQAMRANPFDSRFVTNRAQVHLELKKYREAFWDSKRAIILDQHNSENYYRCACACIEFEWLDDAAEMNQKSLQNCHRDKERAAITKQASLIAEKMEKMRMSKEQKSLDVEVVPTCTDGINFRKLLISAGNHFHRRQFPQSVDAFQQALDYAASLGGERLSIEEEDLHVITYTLGLAQVETATANNLLEAVNKFSFILAQDKHNFPMAFYGLVKAYHRLNRFKEAASYAQEGLDLLQGQDPVDKDSVHLWPTSSCVIEESRHTELKMRLRNLLKECKHPPKPDAFCRVHVDMENPRQEIYFSDPDFKGFVRLTCRARCSVDYHGSCWKAFKASLSEKHADKTMLDTVCPTPGCGSTVDRINIFRSQEPKELVSSLKEGPKTPRPVIKQKVTDPEKLRKKDQQKKQRKQRKAEAVEKSRREKREQEAREEQATAQGRGSATAGQSKAEAQKTDAQSMHRGKAMVLLKDDSEVLLEGKQKSTKVKKKKDKSRQILAVDVQFRGDEEKNLVSAATLDGEGDSAASGIWGLLPTPGTAIWPIGNGLLPVPTSIPKQDETAASIYEFFSGFLRVNGPQDINSPLLQDLVSDFPGEATRKIDSYGGLENFLRANKCFAVVHGRILANAEDQARAEAMLRDKAAKGKDKQPFVEPKKPAFSWEEHGARRASGQSSSSKNSELDVISVSSSLDAIDPSQRGGVSRLEPKVVEDASDDDGFITVGKKTRTNSRGGGGGCTAFKPPLVPMVPHFMTTSQGPNFLARAEAAAKLDLNAPGPVNASPLLLLQDPQPQQAKTSKLPFGGRRSLRDDLSDVTTHSSDSGSALDAIEELCFADKSLTGSGNSSSLGGADRRENSFAVEGKATFGYGSLLHGGDITDGGTTLPPSSSKPFAAPPPHQGAPAFSLLAMSAAAADLDAGTSTEKGRRDSDGSVRSEELQRSCSPASQASSGCSGHSQPAPLQPLKPLAGMRRGKVKARREGHASSSGTTSSSRLSQLAKNEPGRLPAASSSLDAIDSIPTATAPGKWGQQSDGGNGKGSRDEEALILEEMFDRKRSGEESIGDHRTERVGVSPRAARDLEENVAQSHSIWDTAPIENVLPLKLNLSSEGRDPPEDSSHRANAKIGVGNDSLKGIWSKAETDLPETDESGKMLPSANPFTTGEGPRVTDPDIPSTVFMPSFSDTSLLGSGMVGSFAAVTDDSCSGGGSKETMAAADNPWPRDIDITADLERKASTDSLSSGLILGNGSSIWGGPSKAGSRGASHDDNRRDDDAEIFIKAAALFPSSMDIIVDGPPFGDKTSAPTLSAASSASLPPFSSLSSSQPKPMTLPTSVPSNLNPLSREFVPFNTAPSLNVSLATTDDDYDEKFATPSSSPRPESLDHAGRALAEVEAKVTGARTSCSKAVNTDFTFDQLAQMLSNHEADAQTMTSLAADLEREQQDKKRLQFALDEKTKECEDMGSLLKKIQLDVVGFEKDRQARESEISELKKQVAQEQKRAVESEKKFLAMMSQLLAQKLKSRRAEGQRHLQQLNHILHSLKGQSAQGQTASAIVSKAKEWETFDLQCDFQSQTLSTLYGRYNKLLDQGMALDQLPDITARVVIPEMPKPPSWDDMRETSLPLSSQESSSSQSSQAASRDAAPPQSAMLNPTTYLLDSASGGGKIGSNSNSSGDSEPKRAPHPHAAAAAAPPGFKRPPPLTLPLKQRLPKASSLASQMIVASRSDPSTTPHAMTAYEKIVNDLQTSFPHLSRDDISKMIDDLRHFKGGRLSDMNVREISEHLSAMVQDDPQTAQTGDNSSLGDVISISRRHLEEDICPICHEELACLPTQSLQCAHTFHHQCIKQWFTHQRSCPVCRVHSLLPDEFPRLS